MVFRFASISIVATFCTSCISLAPIGYKKLERTELCRSSALTARAGGGGGIFPGFSYTYVTSIFIPTSMLGVDQIEGHDQLKLTFGHVKAGPIPPITGKAEKDEATGLFFIGREGGKVFIDNPDHPSFLYDCETLDSGEPFSCMRRSDLGGWDYVYSFKDLSQWKKHEDLIKRVFEQKLIVVCK
jgi:hypothetical protein